MAKQFHTLPGAIDIDSLGMILPHEHLFTDLRGPYVAGYGKAELSAVRKVVEPYLEEAAAAGVTALVECSTVGVGRNLPVLRALAEATSIHILAPTGVYRDAYIPQRLRDMSESELAELWTKELTDGIDSTSIQAGFIKLDMSDDGPTALEIRNLNAAARASQSTGAVIASHTIGGRVAQQEMDVLEGSRSGFGALNLGPRTDGARYFCLEGCGAPRSVCGTRHCGSTLSVATAGGRNGSCPHRVRLYRSDFALTRCRLVQSR
jgi:phosphotriesterase-related protein